MSTAQEDRFLTVAELIVYSGLSRATLERAMQAERDPLLSHQVGRRVLVRRSDFDAWMLRRRRTISGEAPILPTRRMLARLMDDAPANQPRAAAMKSNRAKFGAA